MYHAHSHPTRTSRPHQNVRDLRDFWSFRKLRAFRSFHDIFCHRPRRPAETPLRYEYRVQACDTAPLSTHRDGQNPLGTNRHPLEPGNDRCCAPAKAAVQDEAAGCCQQYWGRKGKAPLGAPLHNTDQKHLLNSSSIFAHSLSDCVCAICRSISHLVQGHQKA